MSHLALYSYGGDLVASDSCDPVDFSPPGQNSGVDCHFLLQGIFLTQGSNTGSLHCRQILYRLSYQESPLHSYRILVFVPSPHMFFKLLSYHFGPTYIMVNKAMSLSSWRMCFKYLCALFYLHFSLLISPNLLLEFH